MRAENGSYICPTCGQDYDDDAFEQSNQNELYIRRPTKSQVVNLNHAIQQIKWMTKSKLKVNEGDYLGLAFDLIAQSKDFVHFLTYSIDTTFLTALYFASRFTHVKGIVANGVLSKYDRNLWKNFTKNRADMNFFEVVLDGNATPNHAKLIIVDGLVCLTGSANLTCSGFVKITQGKDTFDLVSEQDKVINLNNMYFASQWKNVYEENSRYVTDFDI